jgi:four helix bundle protein
MNQESGKIRTFFDLIAWQEGHKFVLGIYAATKTFPKDELFGLVSQMKRAAVSVTSNIAEGFSRQSYKEKVQFYFTSLASVTELQNQLLIARDTRILPKEAFVELADQSIRVHKLINGLIKGAKKYQA